MKIKSTMAFICIILLLMSTFVACNKSSSNVQITPNVTSPTTTSVLDDTTETTPAEEQTTAPLNEGPVYAKASDTYFVTGIENFNGTSVNIPDTYNDLPVVAIKNSAFANCTSITDVTLGNNITIIGESAFAGCTSLTTVELSEGIETIKATAFENAGLTSITIPSTVTELGNNCFAGCRNLQAIYFNGTMAQWKAIKKGNMMYLECGTTGAICTDGITTY